jgi:hypothetical protein
VAVAPLVPYMKGREGGGFGGILFNLKRRGKLGFKSDPGPPPSPIPGFWFTVILNRGERKGGGGVGGGLAPDTSSMCRVFTYIPIYVHILYKYKW